MFKFIVLCAIIAIAAGAPSVAFVEPTTILGRIVPQPKAPASTEHAKLVPALRYSPWDPTTRLIHEDPLYTSYVSPLHLPYARPYEASSYRISY